MALRYITISAVCTVISYVGLQLWAELSLDKLKSDGLIDENFKNAGHAIELLGSHATIGLLANFMINVFVLLILSLKTIFFSELYASETRKLVERLVSYIIYKGAFLPLIVPPTVYQAGLWSVWLTLLCVLKMFQALARDRLDRLNASPSATPWAYFRVYSALLLVLFVDLFWVRQCLVIYNTLGSSLFLLLFFEPCSIAFETLQAILVHGFQLLDIWLHHSALSSSDCQRSKFLDASTAGSLWEWKGILARNLGFSFEMAKLLMALGHYLHIWWLHGMAFHLIDAVLFLNIRALLSTIIKRMKGFIRLRTALGSLHAAFPDATSEELLAYDDECAICRERMAKAKKLSCNHLFHLQCLKSWLDQGLNETYSCPTCRKPLFARQAENDSPSNTVDMLSDEQLAHQISTGLDRSIAARQTLPVGVFPNQTPNPVEGVTWRGAGLDSAWMQPWPSQGLDGAGPSTPIRSAGLGRVQMMMRHLASVGETYAQIEDAAWTLWPMNPSQASASSSAIPPASGSGRLNGGPGGLHMRTAMRSANDNIANFLDMAETVREVLPHIPDDIIFEDLQRTNSVTVTVNNLLQM